MRIIIMILVGLLVLLQIQVWRQYGQVAELGKRVDTQREQNNRLAARNEALEAEVADLKSGLDAVEERARSELGLIRADEEFYLVVRPEDLDSEDARAIRQFEDREEDRLEQIQALEADGRETPEAGDTPDSDPSRDRQPGSPPDNRRQND